MERSEDIDYIPPGLKDQLGRLATVLVAVGIIAYVNAPPPPKPPESNTGVNPYPSLIPDLSGFLKLNTDDTCFNGGERPCAMVIRSQPYLESPFVNAVPGQHRVKWPFETYNGKTGDEVLIDCYMDTGETVHALDGSSSSSVWYRVVVPDEPIENEEISQMMNDGTIPTVQYAGEKALLAWAAAEWFGQTEPAVGIQECQQ